MTQKVRKIPVAILGASGYTGAELIRLALSHPHIEMVSLVADSNAGKPIESLYPHLANRGLPNLVDISKVDWKKIEAVFCCLPHGMTQEVVVKLPAHLKIIDLSADFRLFDLKTYEHWYHKPHAAPKFQKDAVYGLSEHFAAEIKKARLIACPGCYPTSAQLPLIPLLKEKIIETEGIIIDAKSGVSGAGRSLKAPNLFTEVNESIRPYGLEGHRHQPEIEQGLTQAAGKEIAVTFVPQVVPMNRGILSTIYGKFVKGKKLSDARKALEKAYKNTPFVELMPEGHAPQTREVYGTNLCRLNIFQGRLESQFIITSVIDNLTKGASGQALQNFNLVYGFPEETGLPRTTLFP